MASASAAAWRGFMLPLSQSFEINFVRCTQRGNPSRCSAHGPLTARLYGGCWRQRTVHSESSISMGTHVSATGCGGSSAFLRTGRIRIDFAPPSRQMLFSHFRELVRGHASTLTHVIASGLLVLRISRCASGCWVRARRMMPVRFAP